MSKNVLWIVRAVAAGALGVVAGIFWKLKAMTPADKLAELYATAVPNYISAVATAGAAYLAVEAYMSWEKQEHQKRKSQCAETILSGVLTACFSLDAARMKMVIPEAHLNEAAYIDRLVKVLAERRDALLPAMKDLTSAVTLTVMFFSIEIQDSVAQLDIIWKRHAHAVGDLEQLQRFREAGDLTFEEWRSRAVVLLAICGVHVEAQVTAHELQGQDCVTRELYKLASDLKQILTAYFIA